MVIAGGASSSSEATAASQVRVRVRARLGLGLGLGLGVRVLRRQLPVQSIVRHQVDVLDPILLGDGRDSPPRPELDRSALSKGFLVHRERQAQVLLEVAIVAAARTPQAGV